MKAQVLGGEGKRRDQHARDPRGQSSEGNGSFWGRCPHGAGLGTLVLMPREGCRWQEGVWSRGHPEGVFRERALLRAGESRLWCERRGR